MGVIYKALFVADLHLSNRLPYARPGENDVTDRLSDQLKLIDRIHLSAKKHKVDSIFVIGDLFDQSRVDAVTLTHTVRALAKASVPVYILAGNHDANSVRGGRFTVEAFGEMDHELLHYMDTPLKPTSWLTFWPLHFSPIKVAEVDLENIKKERAGGVNVLLFHNSVLGCDHLEWTCDDGLDPDVVCDGFDWAIGGHFHTRQFFGKNQNGLYVGAPMHHHYGDRGRDAGWWIGKFKKSGVIDLSFVCSRSPRFYVTKEMKISDEWKRGDYVRLELEATSAEWASLKPKAKAFCDNLDGINATFKHKPVYHHKKRLKSSKSEGTPVTLDVAISEYVDAGAVATDGLDKKVLKRIGKEILATVRDKHGTV